MPNKQPRALRLADAIALFDDGYSATPKLTAALLRTQHALLVQARDALEQADSLIDGYYQPVEAVKKLITSLNQHLNQQP